ncbi:MAG: diguanylate cyclase [Rhodoferax sp.]|uniref:diguanylate cyclase n=1 Tax=Rhodoferax sp. TaxID=50421 RepID=UPI001400245B|nr:diguanylate cyclase [Rhodoferax sp.]NDP39113.1 diguanylate cyclase [Rhodoferax sp.]
MSCPPAELKKKSDELLFKWWTYLKSPDFEPFVEFSVCLSSFSDFLQNQGLSGLHQLAHQLEQQALTLFDEADQHQMSVDTLNDLCSQIESLGARVTRFIDSNTRPMTQRREAHATETACVLNPTHRIWFISNSASSWQALMSQLAYFGIQAEIHPWQGVPSDAEEPRILLLDTQDMALATACEHIQSLRTRFSASKLLVSSQQVDFNSFKVMLRAGCDFCLAVDTPQSAILARIMELCGNEEEAPYRVLVVEDSLTASKSIQRTLKQSGIESFAVANPADVLNGLRQFEPDLILMDMYMPDCTGVEATRVIRQHAEFLSTPVVYLSGDGDMALQVDALRLGGDHFLTKPFNPVFLNAVVKSKIERYRALRRSMQNDGLTGLFNHRTIKEKLNATLDEAATSGKQFTVAMIDIDEFKNINDRFGHPNGDQVIRSLAWLLKQRLRKTDLVGRYGGEEFLVVLPGSDSNQAFDILDRIRVDFSRIRYPFRAHWFESTFSAGVSHFPGTSNAEALIKEADEMLYDAKLGGRNRVLTVR